MRMKEWINKAKDIGGGAEKKSRPCQWESCWGNLLTPWKAGAPFFLIFFESYCHFFLYIDILCAIFFSYILHKLKKNLEMSKNKKLFHFQHVLFFGGGLFKK